MKKTKQFKFTPGTCGVVQRVHRSEPAQSNLKVMKAVSLVTCVIPQFVK